MSETIIYILSLNVIRYHPKHNLLCLFFSFMAKCYGSEQIDNGSAIMHGGGGGGSPTVRQGSYRYC